MSSDSKKILDETVDRLKALSLSRGFETPHLSFSHPSGLMRKLSTIVCVLLGIVSHVRQDRSLRSAVALQFVSDHPERFLALPPHQSTKEQLGCTLIAPRLQQNIDDVTVLIHGTPKIMLPAIDFHEDFVQIPDITEASLFLLQTPCIIRSEFPAPSPDGFVGNNNTALGQKIFHITEAQTKAMVDPHRIADDFWGKTVSVVTGSGAFHGRSLSQLPAEVDNTALGQIGVTSLYHSLTPASGLG
jgi:hypothetical protein